MDSDKLDILQRLQPSPSRLSLTPTGVTFTFVPGRDPSPKCANKKR
jgi:hypothetical protein